jgi:hypothetical protein
MFRVPLRVLLKLRRDEAEAFAVYRDTLRLALREVEKNGVAKAKTILNDVVQPELHKLDLIVRRNRRRMLSAAARDALFATGAITIGLATGFIAPGVADAVAALGGIKYGVDTVRNVNSAFVEPEGVQKHPYYFLWKATKMAAV